MWKLLRRIFSVNPDWSDSMLSNKFRPKADLDGHGYEEPESTASHAYHSRDTRRSFPPTISICTDAIISDNKSERLKALQAGISPGPVFKMTLSSNQSPSQGLFTVKNYR